MSARCLDLPVLEDKYFNPNVKLPYELTTEEIKNGMMESYQVLHAINEILFSRSQRRLEDTILGNSLSGMISELLVKGISDTSKVLIRNERIGGNPDLLPKGHYVNNSVLHGVEGVEIKASIQRGGWQGHNPEEAWIMIFRYEVDTVTLPIENRGSSRFVQVLIAKLVKADWSFSGRNGESRRTPTASITATGMHKLRSNPIYQEPGVVVNPGTYSYESLTQDLPL